MSMIESFKAAINSPELKAVVEHWDQIRGNKRLPAWDDIQPRGIAHQLPVTWSYLYRKEDDAFIGRIAGDRIEAVLGKSIRGKNMSELFRGQELEWLHVTCKRVVVAMSLHWGSGVIMSDQIPLGSGERVILPMGSSGEAADGVLGATVYPSVGIGGPSFDFYEQELWCPARPARG